MVLKRSYRMIDGVLHVQARVKRIEKLGELMPRKGFGKPRKSPMSTGPSQIESMPGALEEKDKLLFRTCVGVLLYVASDFAEAQFAIRLLATQMASPTRGAFAVLQHVAQYLAGCKYNTLGFEPIKQNGGFVVKSTEEPVLEVMTDADWSGDPEISEWSYSFAQWAFSVFRIKTPASGELFIRQNLSCVAW